MVKLLNSVTRVVFPLLLLFRLSRSMASSSRRSDATPAFRRGLIATPLGMVHYTAVGQPSSTKLPVVAFHMSPRSVDEYKEVMELCLVEDNDDGSPRLFVAMDELGYGDSDNPSKTCTLDEIADCFKAVIDHLGISKFVVAGSLMGCYFALSLAARYPDQVAGVVCTNLYYFQREAREKALQAEQERLQRQSTPAKTSSIQDSWDLKGDGSHISEIWGKRSGWLTPELNTRATLDDFRYLVKRRDRYAKGISIQDGSAFPLDSTCSQVTCPVVCINGVGAVAFLDSIGMDMSGQFQEALLLFPKNNRPETVTIEKPASINVVNENAQEWLDKVNAFADKLSSCS